MLAVLSKIILLPKWLKSDRSISARKYFYQNSLQVLVVYLQENTLIKIVKKMLVVNLQENTLIKMVKSASSISPRKCFNQNSKKMLVVNLQENTLIKIVKKS